MRNGRELGTKTLLVLFILGKVVQSEGEGCAGSICAAEQECAQGSQEL